MTAPPDQPEDAALRRSIEMYVAGLASSGDNFRVAGELEPVGKEVKDDYVNSLMQLFHAHEAQAVQAAEHYYSHRGQKQAGYAKGYFCACGKFDQDRDRLLRHIHWHELKLQSTQPPAADTPQPSNELCFDCGNKTFWYDNAYRCIYDGAWHEVPPAADTTKQGEGESDE